MPNVLIIEDQQGVASIIYNTITLNFPDCVCYPRGSYNQDFRKMQTLINLANEWEEADDENVKKEKRRLLIEYIRDAIMEGKVPDFAIIDVSLKENGNSNENDETGAKLRRSILSELYPNLNVLYSTDYPQIVYPIQSKYQVKGRSDMVLNKSDIGPHTYFREILLIDFQKYSNLNPEHKNRILVAPVGSRETTVEKFKWEVRIRSYSNDFTAFTLFVCKIIKMLSILLSVFFLLISFVALLVLFIYEIIKNNDDSVRNILQIIEKLFIIPLPMTVITSFFILFDQISTRFNTDIMGISKNPSIEANSKYYINLSKSLFVSTLISVLVIKMLELIFERESSEMPEWERLTLLGASIAFLLIFYLIIARSLKHLLKLKGH